MDGRKCNHNQEGQPKAKMSRSSVGGNPNAQQNGHGREILCQKQQMNIEIATNSQLGTRTMMNNAEGGLQNGLKTTSVAEATNPGSRAEGDVGKNKAPKSPNNTNGPPSQFREHEQYLPIANVVRIMRKVLPAHAKVGDEAKELVQECVSEFISFLTSEANATCQQEHRKTVTAEDLIGAMSRLGFEHYVAPLMMYLQKYRENEMLPMITRSSGSHGSNIGPPPGFMYHQYAMFGSAGNGVYYQDPSGPSNGIGNMGQESIAAPLAAAATTAATVTAAGGYGPSSGPAMMGGYSAGDGGAGPSWSPQADETGFYDPYGKFE
ncbi:uncharacterized protein LOC141586132 [Silene latifolia]|uniref:uncharacterized protein LOC141586132 n=1 Tax=Silene latifolia TaxID=37657 RepID=UPI003D787E2F